MSEHQTDCQCDICNHPDGVDAGLVAFREKQKQLIEKYGWVVHCVSGTENRVNYHTHGFDETQNHLDFQIVYPIDAQIAHSIFGNLFNEIKAGSVFYADENYSGIIQGYKIRLIRAIEGERPVLRVILPDRDGNLLPEDLEGTFAEQYL